jgi:hypothetical protein
LEAAWNDSEAMVLADRRLAQARDEMRASGIYTPDEIREANELCCRARWRLGQLLAEITRAQGTRTDLKATSAHAVHKFIVWLKDTLNLDRMTAHRAQQIGTLPEAELEKAFSESHKANHETTLSGLLIRSRPYWYSELRRQKHQTIAASAIDHANDNELGPFPLIYADPPWKFAIYSEKGLERTPDQHYPTLTERRDNTFHDWQTSNH